jgi:hypothetical protein
MEDCSIAIRWGSLCQLEAAQAGILELINQGTEQAIFLQAFLAVCVPQQYQEESETRSDTSWPAWPESLGKGFDRMLYCDVSPALLVVRNT